MWNHWVLFNIPPTTSRIGEGDTPQATAGTTTSGTNEYQGPCPPDGQHRYFFKIYALDATLQLEAGASKEAVLEAMNGHVIATGELMGTYERQQ
jgi:Raf kinase inhibitor-like YbhB/YbcL family protein